MAAAGAAAASQQLCAKLAQCFPRLLLLCLGLAVLL
jgi:hypothetical protein